MTFRNLDGTQLSDEECICRGAWSLECPVDVHRARWLQSHQDWSDVEAPRTTPTPDVEITQYKPASLFGDDEDEIEEELQMSKKNGFIDTPMLLTVLKKRIGKRSAKQIATTEFKVSYQFLYKVLAGIYEPGPAIAKALGYQAFTGYRRIAPKPTKKKPKQPKAQPAAK